MSDPVCCISRWPFEAALWREVVSSAAPVAGSTGRVVLKGESLLGGGKSRLGTGEWRKQRHTSSLALMSPVVFW